MTSTLTIEVASPVKTNPIYIYGASGRCWKFNDSTEVDAYFSTLNPGNLVIDLRNQIVEKYGSEFIKRFLAFTKDFYNNSLIVENIDFQREIIMADGKKICQSPSRIRFFSKSANLIIICSYRLIQERHHLSTSLDILIDKLCKGFNKTSHAYNRGHFNKVLYSNEFFDFWDGDRIKYDSPQVAAVSDRPNCFICFGFRRNHDYTPLNIAV